ncbi:hypothetical protein BDR05DRAFT_951615 [Suillus weaverae]|nr:hypothetical protein BDR05DRAFT_1003879 [Suillus weaverae]KAG2338795.1 hypothetical protein BDR05DRAFT_951615 [Suillus weaverae]
MVFYALVINSANEWNWRYVIAFASRAVADEWWRAVSTSTVSSFAINIRRVNPQFYIHNVIDAASSLTTTGVATQFLGKVFFTAAHDTNDHMVIPSLDFADHLSGNSFYIRSKASPYQYWYYPPPANNPTNAVYVSSTQRTRFHVRRTGSGTHGTVMIGSDGIVITLTTANLSVNVNDSTGQVIVSPAPKSGLKFSDFLSQFAVGSTFNQGLKELLYTEDGEEWELA